MKLKKFAQVINKTLSNIGKTNPEIEFWYGNTRLEVKRIGQWTVVPNVTVHLMKWKPPEDMIDARSNERD